VRKMEKEKAPKKVVIKDLSNFCPYRCFNGGQYWYAEKYVRTKSGKYRVEFLTSAEFDYCRKVGEFRRCDDCSYNVNGRCARKWQYVSEETVEAEIRKAMRDEFTEIIIDRDTIKAGVPGCPDCRAGLH